MHNHNYIFIATHASCLLDSACLYNFCHTPLLVATCLLRRRKDDMYHSFYTPWKGWQFPSLHAPCFHCFLLCLPFVAPRLFSTFAMAELGHSHGDLGNDYFSSFLMHVKPLVSVISYSRSPSCNIFILHSSAVTLHDILLLTGLCLLTALTFFFGILRLVMFTAAGNIAIGGKESSCYLSSTKKVVRLSSPLWRVMYCNFPVCLLTNAGGVAVWQKNRVT